MGRAMTVPIKIERGVPIPLSRRFSRPKQLSRWPLDKMKVGDSFSIPVADIKAGNQMRADISSVARRLKIRVTTRQIVNGAQTRFPCTMRIWRIK